jgi:hypothetical protein
LKAKKNVKGLNLSERMDGKWQHLRIGTGNGKPVPNAKYNSRII